MNKMSKESVPRTAKKKALIALLIILLIVIIAAIIGMIVLSNGAKKDSERMQDIQKIAHQPTAAPSPSQRPTPTQTAEPVQAPSKEPTPTATLPAIPIDFEQLQEANPDIYAWINIPGTEIDYPIVQHSENDAYYLTRNIDGEDSVNGSIYAELVNSKDFSDPNTVIYGHNMKSGAMFAGLHNYEDKAFFDKNSEIIIYTPTQKLVYNIFAAHQAGDEHILNSYDFSYPRIFTDYTSEILNKRDMKANINSDTEIGEDDNIITLSTCVKGQDNKRYLVQAVLNKDE